MGFGDSAFTTALPRAISACFLLLVLIGAWWLTLAPSRFGGPLTPVLVRGTSMEPTYQTGDLVLAYRGSPEPGDVIVYRHPEGAAVIHRLIDAGPDGLVTQGDNVPTPDPWTVVADDVLGVARFSVPGFGQRIRWLTHPMTSAVLAGLVAFVVVLIPPPQARRRRRAAKVLSLRPPVQVSLLLLVVIAAPIVRGAAAALVVEARPLTALNVAAQDVCTYVITGNQNACTGNGGGNGGGGPGGGPGGGGSGGGTGGGNGTNPPGRN